MNNAYLIDVKGIVDEEEQPISFEGMVRSLEITNDYDKYVYPLLKLNASMTYDSYAKIQASDTNKLIITIKQYSQNQVEKRETNTYSYFTKDAIFTILDKEKTPLNAPKESDIATDSLPTIDVTFTLVSEEELKNSRKMVNTVLMNTDMQGSILYLANKFASKPVIFEKPNNEKIYNQVIFPPNNIIRSLKYLDNVYGLYNDGLRVFFDLNAYYIINKSDNSNVDVLDGQYNSTFINVYANDSEVSELLLYDDSIETEESNYYTGKVHVSDLRIINYEDTKKEYVGTTNIIVSQSDNKLNKNVYSESEYKTRVHYNRYNNIHKELEYINNGKKGIFLVCTVDGLDIDAVSCNKKFFINFTNDKEHPLNGEYHILKSVVRLPTGTTGYAGSQATLYLRKK